MIFIKRPAAPAFLTDPNGKWQKETLKAIAHYTQGLPGEFEFAAYNDSKLKDELKKVFVKCAYCETVYGAAYDGDIEHFRPKGRIKEKNPSKPGYYWLANDWDNLLLSCQHCNQRRQHILVGEDELRGAGKLDQFPLEPETSRAKDHTADLTTEDGARLLINPCWEDPQKHLAYEPTEAVIVPLTKMGEISVEIYALRRPLLVQERKKKMLLLFRQMERVREALERLNADVDNQALQSQLKREVNDLLADTKPEAQYAGMCRFFVKKFLKDNNI